MLIDEDLCRGLSHAFVTRPKARLVVARLLDFDAIRRHETIPTANLAVKRFHTGVLACTSAWLEAGWISKWSVGLVLPEPVPGIEEAIRKSLERLSFRDPWAGSNYIGLRAAIVELDFSAFATIEALLVPAHDRLFDLAGASNDDDPL
jgi:hypothetical protein